MFSTIKYVVCIDKLVLNLVSEQVFDYHSITKLPKTGNVYQASSTAHLRPRPSLTKNYRHSWEMWIDGIHIGYLCTDCIRPQKSKTQRFTFKNTILYSLPGWSHYLSAIEEATGLHYSSIGALEIALDIQSLDADITMVLQQLDDIFKYLPREYNKDVRFLPMQRKLSITERVGAYYFGSSYTSSKSSGKQIVAYCKSAEILDSGKDFISEFHAENDLDIHRPVVRIEARYNNRFFRSLANFTVLDLLNPERVEALFIDAIGTSFQFRDLSRYIRDTKNRNRKYVVITLLDFSFLNQQPVIRQRHSVAPEVSSDNTNLRTVKRLTTELIRHGAQETIEELRRFIRANPAPNGQCWYRKIQQYAQEYLGSPGVEQMTMVESVVRILKHIVPA